MAHPALQSPEALLLVPLVLGYVGIAICIAVVALAKWIGRERREPLPGAIARVTRRRWQRRTGPGWRGAWSGSRRPRSRTVVYLVHRRPVAGHHRRNEALVDAIRAAVEGAA